MSQELIDLMKIFDIQCSRCLDTKILWTHRANVFFARMDGGGDYDFFNCDKCSNGHWNRCSHTKDIYINEIHIFHKNDGEWHCINELKNKYEKNKTDILRKKQEAEDKKRREEYLIREIEELKKQKEEDERIKIEQQKELDRIKLEEEKLRQEENERLEEEKAKLKLIEEQAKRQEAEIKLAMSCEMVKNMQISREARIKQMEDMRIENENNHKLLEEKAKELEELKKTTKEQEDLDNDPEPRWLFYKTDNINKEIKNVDVDIEVGKIAKKVYESIKVANGDLTEISNLIQDLTVDIKASIESSNFDKMELKNIRDKDNKLTYIVFIFSNQIENVGCECLEWCGFSSKLYKFSLKYTIIKPKNKAAQKECDIHMTNNAKLN